MKFTGSHTEMSSISAIIKICKVKKIPSDIEDLIFEYLAGKKRVTAHWDVIYNIRRKWDNCFDIRDSWHTPFFLVHLMRQIKYIKRINDKTKLLTFKMLFNNYNYMLKEEDQIMEELGSSEFYTFDSNMNELMTFASQYIEGERKKNRAICFWGLEPSGDGITSIITINYKLFNNKIHIKLNLTPEIFNNGIPALKVESLEGYRENGLIDEITVFKM